MPFARVFFGIVLPVAGALVGLYALFVGYTLLRLGAVRTRLRTSCAQHGWEFAARFYLFFPTDVEDPITLRVTLTRNGRTIRFTVFRSFLPDWVPVRLELEPLILIARLKGRVMIERRGARAPYLLEQGKAEAVDVGIPEADRLFHVCVDKGSAWAVDVDALRVVLAYPNVIAALDACGGKITFGRASAGVGQAPVRGDVFDWLERVAALADLLDEAAASGQSPYR